MSARRQETSLCLKFHGRRHSHGSSAATVGLRAGAVEAAAC